MTSPVGRATSIVGLTKKDKVRDIHGRAGTVIGFTRNHVLIEWTDGLGCDPFTDDGLKAHGITKASPADKLRKVGR